MVVGNLNRMSLASLDLMCKHTGLKVEINDGQVVGYENSEKTETPGAATPRESK